MSLDPRFIGFTAALRLDLFPNLDVNFSRSTVGPPSVTTTGSSS
jgi:hypothetical protein